MVFLHGVNAVYKRAPYELYADPGKGWSFTRADAARMALLGFNVVRLGVIWQGLEPGTLGPDSPGICTPGTPRDPHQFDARVASAYLARVARTVDLLGRFHIYTLLDMHEDVYSSEFGARGRRPGGVQRRPPHRHASRPVVEHVQRSGADRLGPPLLDQ